MCWLTVSAIAFRNNDQFNTRQSSTTACGVLVSDRFGRSTHRELRGCRKVEKERRQRQEVCLALRRAWMDETAQTLPVKE